MQLQLTSLESDALKAQMNPHFIFNAMNSLQSYINNNELRNSNTFLTYFGNVIRGTMQAAELQEINIRKEVELLRSYLELERMRFDRRFTFEIEVGLSLDPDEITIPPMLIQPIVENAILHGLGPKDYEGRISIDFQLVRDTLVVTVKDSGVGFNQTKAAREGHVSTGLSNTRKRIRILNERNNLEIQEIRRDNGNVEGTAVTLYLHLDETARTSHN